MKHLRRFNETTDNLKSQVVAYINQNYSEDSVINMLDNEITSGNWLEDDWEDEFDNEHDAYMEYSRGEAEAAVRMEIERDVLKKFNITYEQYREATHEELWDTILEIFPDLDK